MKKSPNPSSIRSKKEITDALIKLMQDNPFSEITVKQIVLETGLERKTFYNNFSSKDDVLDSIINNAIYEYVQALTTSPDGPLSVIFDFCDKNRDMLQLLHKNNMLYLLLIKLNVVIPELNESLDMSNNPFHALIGSLEPDYLIAFNIGAIWNVIFKWVDRGMTDSPEYIKEILEEYLKRI
ncbi:transcriptional regulator, TetR family [Lachnospiraceae bacterium]|nr:transcriptional regulator, TetR family [Lachnospiraceae bacterium]